LYLITQKEKQLHEEVLGIDIGGVIIDRVNDNTDTSFFGSNYLRTSAVPGAFEEIRKLVDGRFGSQVYLVSKCGKQVEAKSRDWLAHHRFHELTGVCKDNIRFCLRRHEKAGICEELGITHFVDDRLEVLSHLTSVRSLFLFQPRLEEVRKFSQHLSRVQQVQSWAEISNALLS
jgi:hypothetical protein